MIDRNHVAKWLKQYNSWTVGNFIIVQFNNAMYMIPWSELQLKGPYESKDEFKLVIDSLMSRLGARLIRIGEEE